MSCLFTFTHMFDLIVLELISQLKVSIQSNVHSMYENWEFYLDYTSS